MASKHTLTFSQPAIRWTDALPTGNGHVGAMLYGSICDELILLNHEAVFRPQRKYNAPDVSDALSQLRDLLKEGRYSEANRLFPELVTERGDIEYSAAYHPVCDLRMQSHADGPFQEYQRGIDLDTGLVFSKWSIDEVLYSRTVFVSRTDDLVVVRMATDSPGSVSTRVGLIPAPVETETEGSSRIEAPAEATYDIQSNETWCSCFGSFADFPGEFAGFGAVARVLTVGDNVRVSTGDDLIEVVGADELVILIRVLNRKTDPEEIVTELSGIDTDWDALFERHSEVHKDLYNRTTVDVSLEEDDANLNVPMEHLLSNAFSGVVAPRLLLSMFRFGRYLGICSNGTEGWPANLQGIWNGAYHAPWQSDYHNDENIQMNYWAMFPGMLPELTRPLFDYYTRFIDDYRTNAKSLYGCRGIFLPIAQTISGTLYPSIWSYWTGGAGWLAQHFFDYYLFTQDEDFLRTTALPWLVEVAQFYEDFLIEGEDGNLLFSPSLSPENRPAIEGGEMVCTNATMDVAICREVLSNLIEASTITGEHQSRIPTWETMLQRLPAYEINADGALREWLTPGLEDNYHHRHQSHIYPLFPGFSFTKEDEPDLFEACRIAIEKRLVIGLSSQTGWSFAHMANVWARLGEGDKALEVLELLTRSCTGPNLFTYHNDYRAMGLTLGRLRSNPLFQIDANFGITAAVLELLVFSRPGLIKLLPAVPSTWKRGRAGRILCRGGVTVEFDWDFDAGSITVQCESRVEQQVVIKLPCTPTSISARARNSSQAIRTDSHEFGPEYVAVNIPADTPIVIEATL